MTLERHAEILIDTRGSIGQRGNILRGDLRMCIFERRSWAKETIHFKAVIFSILQ